MRCLVTGASGHLGSFLVRLLVEQGHEVIALVRADSSLWRLEGIAEQVKIIHGDLTNYPALRRDVVAMAPEAVFHLAWAGVTAENRNDPRQLTCNVTGTLELCDIAREARCGTWIGVGSQAEYGPYEIALHEDLPPRPKTVYGVAKLCSGLLTQKMCELAGIRFAWVRLLATYGPMDDTRHLIPTVVRKLMAGECPALTSGEQKTDYLYVEDAARALADIARTATANGFFNLASGTPITVRSLVEQIRDQIDPALALGFGEVPYRPDQVMYLCGDAGRLAAATGWKPTVSLVYGLARTINWARQAAAGRGRDGTSSVPARVVALGSV